MAPRAEVLAYEAGPVLDMSELAITEAATRAHALVISVGMRHLDARDDCADLGIRPAQVEQCPYYREADATYLELIHWGQKSSKH
jgi:hypothetical protein